MTPDSTWFEEPELLEGEIRLAFSDRQAPPRIHGYESVIEIARGGQGLVFRAVQSSTRRTVAIKVLRDSAPTPADRRRFEREIDLAASLRHPHIVSIYDSGVTGDGRPYLVMEFVEGRPIDQHLGKRPAIDRAVSLLAEVCDAVGHAHLRGVIHRDLKPSNIRVDGEGHARVLDFGLARGTDDPSMTISASGHFVGSLPWSSPEQAEGRTGDVDVRSDVYALGVVMFQLLTGEFPYDVASGMRVALESIASAEPARPGAKRPEIDEELETIVLKCLAKEPERRYQSADALGRDLRRYLAGEPIEAKRDSAWYTVRKRLVRYRVAAAAASVVALAAVGALVAVNVFRVEAGRQRDLTRDALEEAREINAFMEEAFTAVDPFKSGIDTSVRDVLDNAAATVDERFAERPRVRESVHSFLGMTFWNLGELERAAEHLEASLALRRELLGPDHPDLVDTENNLGAVLADLLRFEEAGEALTRALEGARREFGEEAEQTLAVKHNLAYLRHYEGKLAEAAEIYRDVLEAQHRTYGPDDAQTLTTMNCLAPVLWEMGYGREGHEMFGRVLAGRERTLGVDHPSTLLARQNVASSLHRLGRAREAVEIQERCAVDFERVLGEMHPWALTNAGNLAGSLVALGRYAEAEERSRELLPLLEESLGAQHETTLKSRYVLAHALAGQGRGEEAVALARGSLEGLIGFFGEDDGRTLAAARALGVALAAAGRADEAEATLRDVVARHDRADGPVRGEAAHAALNLADLLALEGRAGEALAAYEAALAKAEAALPEDHWIRGAAMHGIGSARLEAGEREAAAALLARASELLRGALGPEHERSREIAADLAAVESVVPSGG